MAANDPKGNQSSSVSNGHKGKYNNHQSPGGWKQDIPHTIYFYYFKKQSNGSYDNDFYFVHDPVNPIKPGNNTGELRAEITRLVRNAADRTNTPAPSNGKFGTEPWNRISWLVVAVEGIEIDSGKAAEIKWKKGPGQEEENHSFFDGGDTVEHLGGGRKVGVIWAWNHMRDANGGRLDASHKKDHFHFQFMRKGEALAVEIDESGTNTGPTVAPPPRNPIPVDRGHGKGNQGSGPA